MSLPRAKAAAAAEASHADPVPPATWAPAADPVPPGLHLPLDGRLERVLVATAATLFVLHSAQKFFIPLLLGIIMAYTLNPLVVWLERLKIPRVIGASLVMLALIGTGILGTISLREQVDRILDQVPEAAGRLSAALQELAAEPNTMQKVQAAAREIEQATSQTADQPPKAHKPPARIVVEQPRFKLVDFLWTGSLGMFGLIGEAAMLLLLVFFLLLSGDTFKRKLLRVTGPSLSKKKITVSILDDIHLSIQHYMLTLLVANVLLGLLTWAVFRWIGLENAGAWAAAAGVLHFIPYLGPALTALATGMAAFMQFGSVTMALLAAGSSLIIAMLVGLVLITWMNGKLAKMNATVVFVALFFWGWLWGAWGLLLAIPIMGMVKVFSEHVEDLQPLSELLAE
jgi:predicted PurR-regulated permease PerM